MGQDGGKQKVRTSRKFNKIITPSRGVTDNLKGRVPKYTMTPMKQLITKKYVQVLKKWGVAGFLCKIFLRILPLLDVYPVCMTIASAFWEDNIFDP